MARPMSSRPTVSKISASVCQQLNSELLRQEDMFSCLFRVYQRNLCRWPHALTYLILAIANGEANFLELIELLGPSLTSTEKITRCRGTRLLAEVVHQLPPNSFPEKDTEVILTFFCDRLKDHHSVTPHVLYGLRALATLPRLSGDGARAILQAIFKEVHVQSLVHSDRMHIYVIVNHLLTNRIEDMLPMGTDFVYGFVQTMDGEKDPRNLQQAFQLVTVIAQRFPLGVFVEELFEVVACYFPIDFTPPPSDSLGVSKEQLILGLRRCLCATHKFAEFCLPLLLEKLTSSITSAKIDSLDTLTACSETYGADKLDEYTGSLWSCIRREVCESSSERVEVAALSALSAISRTLINDVTQENVSSRLDGFINEVIADCQKFVCEPEHKLIIPGCRMLQAVASVSPLACSKVMNQVIPVILQQYEDTTQPMQRKNLIEALVLFIRTVKDVSLSGKNDAHPLQQYQSAVYSLLVTLLSDKLYQQRLQAVAGLAGLLATPSVVDKNQRTLLTEHFTNLVLSDSDPSVRKESLAALTFIATEYPEIVKEVTIPRFSVAQVEGSASGDGQGHRGHVTKEYLMTCLAAVSVVHQLLDVTVPGLLVYLTLPPDESSMTSRLSETRTVCSCLQSVIDANITTPDSRDYFLDILLPKCVQLLISNGIGQDDCDVFRDCVVIEDMSAVVRSVVQVLTDSQAADVAHQMAALFVDGNLQVELLGNCLDLAACPDFHPLEVGAPTEQSHLVVLLLAVVCALPQQVAVPRLHQLVDALLLLSCNCCHGYTSTVAAKCLSGLVNKQQGPELDIHIDQIKSKLSDKLHLSPETAVRENIVRTWGWVTKALVLRGDRSQTVWTDQLLCWLEDSRLCQSAVDSFYTVLHEYPDVMSQPMHGRVTLLYRQRFFVTTLGRLKEGFQQAAADQKQFYLTALSYLLRYVPRQVLLSELTSLLPLLLKSLTIPEDSLWQSTLTCLYDLVHDAPEVVSSNMEELLPRLFDLMQYKPKMKVRMAALQCLGSLTTLPTHTILPHQKTVVRHLAATLDDHKRLVRKEAVLARQEWILLDAPGS